MRVRWSWVSMWLPVACGGQVEEPPPERPTLAFIADREALDEHALYTVSVFADLRPTRRADELSDSDGAWWSPDGRWLAAHRYRGRGDEDVVLFDATKDLAVHDTYAAKWVGFSPSGRWGTIVTPEPASLVLESLEESRVALTLDGEVSSGPWSPSEHAWIADVAGALEVIHTDGSRVTLDAAGRWASEATWAPSERFVMAVAATDDTPETLWRIPTDGGPRVAVHGGALSKHWRWLPGPGDRLVTIDDDAGLLVYDGDTGSVDMLLAGPAAMTFQVQDDLLLATRNNEVLVYRASDLAVLDRYDRTSSSWRASLCPGGRHVVLGSRDGIAVIDRHSRTRHTFAEGRTSTSFPICSRDGRFVAYVHTSDEAPRLSYVVVIDLDDEPIRSLVGGWDDDVVLDQNERGLESVFSFVVGQRDIFVAELHEHHPANVLLVHAGRSNLRTVDWVAWRPQSFER